METLEVLSKRIHTTQELRSIVRTMKSLSAVSIHQYETAGAAIAEYQRTIELGLQIALRGHPPTDREPAEPAGPVAVLVFGSDHGLCGRFNELITDFAAGQLATLPERPLWFTLGARARAHLEAGGERIAASLALPGAVSGLVEMAHTVLRTLDDWWTTRGIERMLVFHNGRREPFNAVPAAVQLLPLDPAWLVDLAQRPWPSRSLPLFTMDTEALFAALVRQHLFVTIYRAGAESLASEHASRLAAMQSAEHNIKEHLEELNIEYRCRRQESITDELLDVVAGFEVLQGGRA